MKVNLVKLVNEMNLILLEFLKCYYYFQFEIVRITYIWLVLNIPHNERFLWQLLHLDKHQNLFTTLNLSFAHPGKDSEQA